MTNTAPAAVTADDAPEVGTERYTIGVSSLLALTPIQRNALAGLGQPTDTPGIGLHAARRQVLESRGLVTSQRVGTGRGAWTRVDLTARGRDVAALELADRRDQAAAADANAAQDAEVRAANRRAGSALVREATRSIPAEDQAPEVHAVVQAPSAETIAELDRYSITTATDRIVELEAQLERTEAARSALADDLVAARNGAARQADAYREVRARITELEDAPVRQHARQLVEALAAMTGGRVSLPVSRAYGLLADALGMDVTRPEHKGPEAMHPHLVPDLVLQDEATADGHPAGTGMLRALGLEGLAVRPALPGERVEVRETHRQHGHPLPRTRVLGILQDEVLRTDEGRDAREVPVQLLAAYVADVRALGYPAPTARRAVLDALVTGQQD